MNGRGVWGGSVLFLDLDAGYTILVYSGFEILSRCVCAHNMYTALCVYYTASVNSLTRQKQMGN